jgi:imidazolonepropionase-like amidohydrolase/Tol biopolymer transport system component
LRRFTILLLSALAILSPCASAQGISARRIRFTAHEGSWLSFDVSPDGQWLTLDLLGQLWRLPAQGGVARAITNVVRDSAEFLDPQFSADGRSLIAHGEFRGQLGVFLMGSDGGNLHWIAPDTLQWVTSAQSPALGADQQHILLARHAANATGEQSVVVIERDVRTGVEHPIDITGVDGQDRDGLVYSADGRRIFFNTQDPSAGPVLTAGRIWSIPAAGGVARAITPTRVRARAAAPSPDGRRLAYFLMDSSDRAQVWVQNLTDSVGVQLTNDRDVTPTRIRWLPQGDTLIYVANGRLWRMDVRSRARREIPFSATVDFQRKVARLRPVRFPDPGERLVARGTHGFALAPDGRSFAAILLNGLWTVGTNENATPHKLISVPATAAQPTWSPDGKRIAWQAGKFGAEDVFVTDTATRRTTRLTSLTGRELSPRWSPDGRFLSFTHMMRDTVGRVDIRLRAMRLSDSVLTSTSATIDLGPIAPTRASVTWSPASDAVLVDGPPRDVHERFASLRMLAGGRRAIHGLSYDATFPQWLRGDTLVFLAGVRLWRAPFDATTGSVGHATALSDEAATYLNASTKGDLVYISDDGFRYRSSSQLSRRIGWPIDYVVPNPPPIVVRNVRIIDGTGAAATSPRDILIERARIRQIGPPGTISAVTGASVIDAGGRIAIPGLIDLHSHHYTPSQLRGQLYFGVTSVRTIGGSQDVPADHDAVEAGEWLGPRRSYAGLWVDTDSPFSSEGAVGLRPEQDPHHLARGMRLRSAFAGDFVKIHSNSGFAAQMRTVAAAHASGTRVTAHCAYPLALVAAGMDSKEHLGWQCTAHDASAWHDDLVQLYARSGMPVVPTLAFFEGLQALHGPRAPIPSELAQMFGEEAPQLVSSIGFEPWSAAHLLNTANALDAAKKLHRAGVPIGAGTDFELPDGIHYELAALVDASFTPLEAITAATSVAARIMGANSDVGRIAPGIVADIVILDADPTANIRNTRQIWRVIQGGRVIDRESLYAPGWDTVQIPATIEKSRSN